MEHENSNLQYIHCLLHCKFGQIIYQIILKKKENEISNLHSTNQSWPMHRNALWSDLTIADNIVKKLWI